MLPVVANQAKLSLPICVQTPLRAFVPRPGVIHRDPARRLQPGAQHVARFRQELVLPADQQSHQLPLRDADADRLELGQQTRHRDLPLVVLRQHEAAQLRPDVTAHTSRQGRDHRPPIRGDPALAAIAHDPHPQHDVLHHEILVALEPRARRNLRLEDLLLDADPWCRLASATPTAAFATGFWRSAVLHAARLDPWPALQSLQPRNLLAQLRYHALLLAILLQQLQHQQLQLGRRQRPVLASDAYTSRIVPKLRNEQVCRSNLPDRHCAAQR